MFGYKLANAVVIEILLNAVVMDSDNYILKPSNATVMDNDI